MLNNLIATENVTLGINETLTVLLGNDVGDFILS
jgi:hypothetical protein